MADLVVQEVVEVGVVLSVDLRVGGNGRVAPGEGGLLVDAARPVIERVATQERGAAVLLALEVADDRLGVLRVVLVDRWVGGGPDEDEAV